MRKPSPEVCGSPLHPFHVCGITFYGIRRSDFTWSQRAIIDS
jgi:hypothetical protein